MIPRDYFVSAMGMTDGRVAQYMYQHVTVRSLLADSSSVLRKALRDFALENQCSEDDIVVLSFSRL